MWKPRITWLFMRLILLLYVYMRLSIVLLFVAMCLPGISLAQFGLETFDTPELAITLNPAHPSPGDIVTASLDDYAGGVFGAQINWTYNGVSVPNSNNQRSVQFIAGEAGTRSVLTADLTLTQGTSQSLTRTITPVYMDIVIEPQTRIPDWYQGRSLPSLGSQINATVLLNDGSIIDPQNVVYTWRMNQRVLEGGPIRGGNRVSFITPRGNELVLSVTANDTRGNTIAKRTIAVKSVLPELSFHEKHTLYGVQSVPIQPSMQVLGSLLTVQAEPFFLDTRVYNNPDVAEWEVNSIRTGNGSQNPYEITLQGSNQQSNTRINFHVRSLEQILQGAEESTNIVF